MGYNTTLVILNDAMSEITKDPVGWWEETQHNIASFQRRPSLDTGNDYGFGMHANWFEVAQVAHADVTSVIAVGGNYSTVLLAEYGLGSQHTEEGQIKILKALAKKLGYNVSRKRRAL